MHLKHQNIAITASCDDNYAPHVGVLFLSVLSNANEKDNFRFFLIDNHISEANKSKLSKLVNQFGSEVSFIPAITSDFEAFPTMRYGVATYQRLAMAELLPNDLDKVIYLDSDMVVLGDIAELWQEDLNGNPIAAVENLSPKACTGLGLGRDKYFNAGMLVADLKYWREHHIKDQLTLFLSEQAERIKHLDQCALNGVFEGNWRKLPLKWNLQADAHGVLKKYSNGCGYSHQDIEEAIRKPSIVHFIGRQKPWLWDCHNAYQAFYLHYKNLSPWKDEPRPDANFKNTLKSKLALKKRIRQASRYNNLAINTRDL